MGFDSAAPVEKGSREVLLDLRDKLNNLLHLEDWKSIRDVDRVIINYVLFLRNVNPDELYINKSEELVDLELLKKLQAKLDHVYDKAKEEYFSSQFSYVFAYRRWATMLKDLSDGLDTLLQRLKDLSGVSENEKEFKILVDFQKWIEQQLLDKDWKGILEFTDLMEGQLKKEAEKDGKDVQLLIQTTNSEQIDVNNPEIVKHRFMAYEKELADATRKDEENLYARVHIPERRPSVERLVSILEASCLCKPDDNSMLLNRSQGAVQQSMKRNVNPSERIITKNEELVDLVLLKELQAKLDDEYDKAKHEYFSSQFSYVYAYRRWAMMLKDLSDVLENEKKSKISVDFQKWIEQQLLDKDWQGILEHTHLKEGQLKKEADKDGKDVQFLMQTINSEQIDVNNPEIVKCRFMAYQKELANATRKDKENLCARVHIPERRLSVERLVSVLEDSCLCKPDDNSMAKRENYCSLITDDDALLLEKSLDHCSIQPDDGANLLEKSQDAVQHPCGQMVGNKRQYPPDFRTYLRRKKGRQASL